MDILLTLHKLLAYYRRNRQAGHTTFARTIATVGGVVICANEKEANDIGRKQMRLGAQDQKPTTVALERVMDLDGRMPVPSVLDNHTVMIICEKAIDRIATQDEYIGKLKEDYQILTKHHEASKLLWAQEMQGQRNQYREHILALEGQLSGWKRIARAFKFSSPTWAEKHITAKRTR